MSKKLGKNKKCIAFLTSKLNKFDHAAFPLITRQHNFHSQQLSRQKSSGHISTSFVQSRAARYKQANWEYAVRHAKVALWLWTGTRNAGLTYYLRRESRWTVKILCALHPNPRRTLQCITHSFILNVPSTRVWANEMRRFLCTLSSPI